MSSQISHAESLDIEVSNLGGIEHREAEIPPGITILSGSNATNRTSFLRALATSFGVDAATLQANKDDGYVSIDIDGTEYTRTFGATGSGVQPGGDRFDEGTPSERELAFLLSSHPIRRLIRGDFSATELRDELMQPVDTAAIQRRISELEEKKQDLDSDLEQIEKIKTRRTDNQTKVEELNTKLDRLESEREDLKQQVEEAEESDPDITDTITDLSNTLENKRSEKTTLETKITEYEKRIEYAEDDLENLSGETPDPTEIEKEMEELTEERRDLRDEINRLETQSQNIANLKGTVESVILDQESISDIATNYPIDPQILASGPLGSAVSQDDPVTDALVDLDEKTCPVCGTQVSSDRLNDVRKQLNDIAEPIEEQIESIRAELEGVDSEYTSLRKQKQNIEKNAKAIDEAQEEIETFQHRSEDAEADLEEVTADIAELEKDLEAAEEEKNEEYIQAREDLSRVKSKIDRTTAQRESLEDDIADAADKLSQRDDIEADRERVQSDLIAERQKVSTLESELAATITDELETVVDLLDYENIEMVKVDTKYSGPEQDRHTEFDLTITRTSDGTTYVDNSLDHFSESERAVLGLVVALAAYLVHDVGEIVPVIALDAIEMIDADRINKLVQHFADRVEYLVVALLQEDAQAVEADTEVAF